MLFEKRKNPTQFSSPQAKTFNWTKLSVDQLNSKNQETLQAVLPYSGMYPGIV